MSTIVNVPISQIRENPYRELGTYPTLPKKVEALRRSFEDVGIWEGMIARKKGKEYELAFGHHRLEAAKALKLKEVPLIVRDLSDQQMLQFMGRENGEDYGTEFLIMLNTWEGAVNFSRARAKESQPIDIARLLGWVKLEKGKSTTTMSNLAQACASTCTLMDSGYITREDLADLSVRVARDIVQRSVSNMEMIEKSAQKKQTPPREVKKQKEMVGKAAKQTASDAKRGNLKLSPRHIKQEVDSNMFAAAGRSKKAVKPLFDVFGKRLCESIGKMLESDSAAKRLQDVANVINEITLDDDQKIIRELDHALHELGIRTDVWRKRITPSTEKVVDFPRLEKK